MKAKITVPNKSKQSKPSILPFPRPGQGKLPDPPVQLCDIPPNPPFITQAEILAFINAETRYFRAKADYEQKRAALTLKLLQGCPREPGNFAAWLVGESDRLMTADERRSHNPLYR